MSQDIAEYLLDKKTQHNRRHSDWKDYIAEGMNELKRRLLNIDKLLNRDKRTDRMDSDSAKNPLEQGLNTTEDIRTEITRLLKDWTN